MAGEYDLDFGDPELNDPQYEEKVDAADANTAPDGAQVQDNASESIAPQQQTAQQDGGNVGTSSADNTIGQPEQPKADNAASARPKSDDKGNLIDAEGNVVAAAGAERRTFERVAAQEKHIKTLESDLEAARKAGDLTNALNGAPAQLGLDANDVQMGLQAISSFKKDPVSTARWMLQETMRLGYDLKQIIGEDANGQIASGGLDLAAVKSMISEAVNPLVQDREVQQQNSAAEQSAQREYDAFMAKHDFASQHEEAIAKLVSSRQVTPEVAYWQLREYATANGLDFAQPLGPQVQGRQQGANAQNGNATPQAQIQQQPMPNGGAPTADMQSGPTLSAPDDPWDNIVRQSLAEAGMS